MTILILIRLLLPAPAPATVDFPRQMEPANPPRVTPVALPRNDANTRGADRRRGPGDHDGRDSCDDRDPMKRGTLTATTGRESRPRVYDPEPAPASAEGPVRG